MRSETRQVLMLMMDQRRVVRLITRLEMRRVLMMVTACGGAARPKTRLVLTTTTMWRRAMRLRVLKEKRHGC